MEKQKAKFELSRPIRFRKLYEQCYTKLVEELKTGRNWVSGTNRQRVRNLARQQARYTMKGESA